ncbi:hypothetical protein [Aquibacillus rhizosphaerae]|uniref:Uncharacterized protein n=1 Tax=Aquibacillus rhizosphaerae TaxID=3051431 RepID=A0ABT7L9C7_9BACI|nr:hypothetical protein [Aquibacillus sp. LR5S19]MDL4842461.1 hypothetical protein [Aquibacillus sp. LR5S19]
MGTFEYLSSPNYIRDVLSKSSNISGRLLNLTHSMSEASFYFWPNLENSEPDVVIHFKDERQNEYLICIEAKYLSDKSSYEDEEVDLQDRSNRERDQLAREIKIYIKRAALLNLV